MAEAKNNNWLSAACKELELLSASLDNDHDHVWRTEGAREFSAWLADHADVWSHVELSGLATQLPNDEWVNRCLMIRLVDESTNESELELAADKIRAYRVTRPPAQLATLLGGVFHAGELPQPVSPIPGHRLRISLRDGAPYAISRASSEAAQFDNWAKAQDEWPRFLLEAKAASSLVGDFADNRELSTWMDLADKRLRILGHGSPSDLLQHLRISRSEREVDWNSPPFIKVCAQLPLRVSSLEQAADRTKLHFDLHVGTLVKPGDVKIRIRRTEEAPSVPTTLSIASERGYESRPRLSMDLNGHQDIEFLLLYKGELIQSGTTVLEPPLGENLRLAALRHFESPEHFLGDGLSQHDGHNAHSFERSVAHLLGVLGFSTFYWGPDHNSLKKVLPTPDHQADLLAFAADDQNCLLVECTLDVGRADKLPKLRQRANQLQEFLSARAVAPPNVHPVFAIRVPRAEVPVSFSKPARTDNVTLLTKDDLDGAFARLSAEAPNKEILQHLPSAIRCGWKAQKGFTVWPKSELV